MTKHTLSNFEEALTELKSSVSKMGGLAEKLCQDGLSAFISSNVDMIKNCNEQDKIIDEAERSINQQTFRLLALQAPMAIDLRMIITSLQIASCLERCGDYGRNLARRSDLGLSEASPSLSSGMKRLGEAAILSLHNSLNAHATGNVELANQTFKEAINTAQSISDNKYKSKVLSNIAVELSKSGDVEFSNQYLQQVLNIAQSISDDEYKSSALSNIAVELSKSGNFEEALNTAQSISDDRYKSPTASVDLFYQNGCILEEQMLRQQTTNDTTSGSHR